VEELISKGYIREIISLYEILVFLVSKKYRTWKIYVDCCVINNMMKKAFDKFYRFDGYLFKENKLCVSNCFMHELLICKAHMSGLMRHFRVAKTLDVLHEHFYEKGYLKNL